LISTPLLPATTPRQARTDDYIYKRQPSSHEGGNSGKVHDVHFLPFPGNLWHRFLLIVSLSVCEALPSPAPTCSVSVPSLFRQMLISRAKDAEA
jgi:hypothetical protein